MSITPEGAPTRPAYLRDGVTGLYYKVGGVTGGTFVVCKSYSDKAPSAGGAGHYPVPMEYAFAQKGTDVTYSAGGILVNTAGTYLVGGFLGATGTGISTVLTMSAKTTGSSNTYLWLGGQQPVDPTLLVVTAGSMPWQFSVGDTITLDINRSTTVSVLATYTSLWATRIG